MGFNLYDFYSSKNSLAVYIWKHLTKTKTTVELFKKYSIRLANVYNCISLLGIPSDFPSSAYSWPFISTHRYHEVQIMAEWISLSPIKRTQHQTVVRLGDRSTFDVALKIVLSNEMKSVVVDQKNHFKG